MTQDQRRQAVAVPLGAIQRAVGSATVSRAALPQLWADLPPEYADEVQAAISDLSHAMQALGRVAQRLRRVAGDRLDAGEAVAPPKFPRLMPGGAA